MSTALCLARNAALVLVISISAELHGQEIVRWGDSSATGAREGFDVTSYTWEESTTLSGASTFQLGIDGGGIRVPEVDVSLNLAPLGPPLAYNKHEALFDNDPETTWRDLGFTCAGLPSNTPWNSCDGIYFHLTTSEVDLGAQYPVDRVVIMSGLNAPGLTLRDFSIFLSPELPTDGLRCCPVSAPVLRPFAAEVRDNREQVREVRLPGLQPMRFLQIAVGEHEEGWEIHDVQVFGKGFVESATYLSNIIEFDGPVAWGQLRWAGFQGAGARVMVQTRTGSDADPQLYWRFTGRGADRVEVTREEYEEDLKLGELAGITYDRSNWSYWSAPYEFADSSGARVVSPSPRGYFQFKVDFLSGEEGAELRRLELETWPPVATALVGEIWPVDSSVGEWREYTYSLLPTIVAGDAGFNRLEISSPALLGDVRDIRVGDASVPWEEEAAEPHRVVVRLPHLQSSDTGVLVQVDFDAQVLRYGSTFEATVWVDERTPLTPQRVNPGDATAEFEGNRVSVATSVKDEGLLRVAFQPSVLTPNGDGVNDTALLTYEIFEIIGERTVHIDIFDLAGRRVRQLQQGPEGIGRYERRFDGRDDNTRLLPPGVYVARLSLSTDRASTEQIEIIHIAY